MCFNLWVAQVQMELKYNVVKWLFQSQQLKLERKHKEEISWLLFELQSKAEELGKLQSDYTKLQGLNHDLTLRVEDLQTQLEQNERTKEITTGKEEQSKRGQLMKNDVQGQFFSFHRF